MKPREDDHEIRDMFQSFPEVPFRPSLKERILEQARQEHEQLADERKQRSVVRRRLWGTLGTAAAAACIAVAVIGAWRHDGSTGNMATTRTPASNTTLPAPNTAISQFALQSANLKVDSLSYWSPKNGPANSGVQAVLTNTGNTVIHKRDVVGILAFYNENDQLNDATFVNSIDTGIQPGETVTWQFHPTGPRVNAQGALIDKPALKFFENSFAPSTTNATLWKEVPLSVSETVAPGAPTRRKGYYSVHVSVTLANQTNKPISLKNTAAVIWFDQSSSSTGFLRPDAIRYMNLLRNALTPEDLDKETVQPGQSLSAMFSDIGASNYDYFSRTAHVIIIQLPTAEEAWK